jgi:hypothetical protein
MQEVRSADKHPHILHYVLLVETSAHLMQTCGCKRVTVWTHHEVGQLGKNVAQAHQADF